MILRSDMSQFDQELPVDFIVISRNRKVAVQRPLCILPRASKYLGLAAVLCVYSARYRYLHIVCYKALANSRYFKLPVVW